MSIYELINGLASTIEFGCNRGEKKRLRNHHFTLRFTQQTKQNYGEPCYAESKWYSINFQWVFGMQLIGGGGGRINKALGNDESTLAGN